MCRMIAIARDPTVGVASLLKGFSCLVTQGKVIRGDREKHEDGWGLLAYVTPAAVLTAKSPHSVAQDAEAAAFEQAALNIDRGKTPLVIGHLRKATTGSVSMNNTHPFQEGVWSFCHNGSLFEAELKLPLTRFLPTGTTDSERFFKFILENIRESDTASVLQALSQALLYVHQHMDYTALNFLLSNGEDIFAYRDFNVRYQGKDHSPQDLDDYYTLYWAVSKAQGMAAICSEPLQEKHLTWHSMQNKELVILGKTPFVNLSRYRFESAGQWQALPAA